MINVRIICDNSECSQEVRGFKIKLEQVTHGLIVPVENLDTVGELPSSHYHIQASEFIAQLKEVGDCPARG